MLYDNAQLASLYLHGWLATGDAEYRRVAEETLDYVLREMTHPAGGFYSAQDADSEGVEGKFFVWTPDEIRAVARRRRRWRAAALAYWGVDDGPNFEGHSILFVPREPAEVARTLGMPADELAARSPRARTRLYAAREKRVHPGLDDKVLASWNGLHARGVRRGRPRAGPRRLPRRRGRATPSSSRRQMVRDGRLLRSWKDGQARINGYLEDYAMVGGGPARALRGDLRPALARRVAPPRRGDAAPLLGRPSARRFFDTGDDQEALVVRPRNLFDNAVPSGTSVAIEWLLRLARRHSARSATRRIALAGAAAHGRSHARYPSGFGRYLCALDFHLGPVAEVALVWPAGAERAAAPLARRRCSAATSRTGWWSAPPAGAPAGAGLPLLAERGAVDGRPTAYVCRRYVCQLPVTDAGRARAPARRWGIIRIASRGEVS